MVSLFVQKSSGAGNGTGLFTTPKSLEMAGLSQTVRLDSSDSAPVWRFDSANGQVPFYRGQQRNDALFPSEALVEVEQRVIEQRLPPLTALLAFGRKGSTVPWKERIRHYGFQQFGRAAQICCANDFPRVSIDGGEIETPTITIGTGFEICYADLMRGQAAGMDIAVRLMAAARQAINQQLNNYAWYGDSAAGIMGVANNPMIGLLNAPFRLDDPSINPLTRIGWMAEAVNQPMLASSLAMPAIDAVAVAPSLMRALKAQRVSNFDKSTVWGDFLEQAGIKKVTEVPQLECLNGGERTMFLYSSQDAQVEWNVPLPMQVMPAFDNGYGYSVNMVSRINSLWLDYPRHAIKVIG